jgi:hypothetical protein
VVEEPVETLITERRTADRRVRRVSIHYPERRRGFDRRLPDRGPIRTGYHRMLLTYRKTPAAVATVLIAVVILNAVDLLLTVRAIGLGATELNPIMAGLLGFDPVVAAVFKLTLVAVVALSLWVLRGYRRTLEASLIMLGVFALVAAYHVIGISLIG